MGGHEARGYWEDWGLVLLWTSMLAGPTAFALNHQIGYALVKWACSREQTFLLTLVAVATFGLAMWGAYLGWTCLQKLGDANDRGGRREDRSYFMALVAIGLDLLIALLIIMAAFPQFILSPCE
jgi:hypothetical protein